MIKEGTGVGGINDLTHWSEGDLYACFLQSNNYILQQCHFFPNPMLETFIFKSSCLEKAIIFRHFLSNVKRE